MSSSSCYATTAALAASSAASVAAICIMSDDENNNRTVYSKENRETHCLGTDSIEDKIKYLKEERETLLKELDDNKRKTEDLKSGKFLPKLEEAKVNIKKSAIKYLSIGTILMLSGLPVWINISKYIESFPGGLVIVGAATAGFLGLSAVVEGISKLNEHSKTEECIEDYKDYLEKRHVNVESLSLDEETIKKKMNILRQKDAILREKLSLTKDKSERMVVRKQIIDNYNAFMELYVIIYPEAKNNSDYKLVLK